MLINLESIRQHAGEKLRCIESPAGSAERLASLKKFIKTEAKRLQLRHRFGVDGPQIVAARSLIVDLLIERMARAALEGPSAIDDGRLAVVALGGYGRRELAPHSDIDLLFLHQGRRDAGRAAALSEAILYPLWDVGFTVGHSCRLLRECIDIAKSDLSSRNALIDARLLCGSQTLFDHLSRRLDDQVFGAQRRALLDELMTERITRYGKFGEVVCMQEPDVKETAGGLRDLHSLLWATRVAYGQSKLADLMSSGLMPERDARTLKAAYDYLLRVRNDLHFLTGRRNDLLTLDLQAGVARDLRYSDTAQLQASEAFMRDYYLQARRLHRLTDVHLRRALAQHEKTSWFGRGSTVAAAGGFIIRDGVLEVEKSGAPLDAGRLMRAFDFGQATGATFGSTLQDLVQTHLPVVNRQFRSAPETGQWFLNILRTKGRVAAALHQMHELGFLGKYVPEFGRITCLVQHDLYHRYTIDEHMLRAIGALDELANSRQRVHERYRQVYSEVKDPALLHLGILMHDIGKGLGGGHVEKGIGIAARVCARLHLDPEAKEKVAFLVRCHLIMAHTSQRRDLSDEGVIEGFAAQVGTLDHLNMLTLLTYGDLNGVGPNVWNEWKDALLWELYTKARAFLHPEEGDDDAAEHLREEIAHALAGEVDLAEVRSHFNRLPEDYARFTAPQAIMEHIRLAHMIRSHPVGMRWAINTQARCTDLHLCALDRRGLFATVAGTLTAHGVNILSVQLMTRADGLAIESFKVRDTDGEPIAEPKRWTQIEGEIQRALQGDLDVAEAVARRLRSPNARPRQRARTATIPTRITWDHQSSERSTILEVRTGDRLGLAYKIASTLAALDLDIVFAKVATEKHQALDIFYITDASGEKLRDPDLPKVEAAIRQALSEGRVS